MISLLFLLSHLVEESLKEIKNQTEEALTSVSTQSDKVNDSLISLEAVLEDLKKGDEARKDEFNNVKNDVAALQELVPKVNFTNFYFSFQVFFTNLVILFSSPDDGS